MAEFSAFAFVAASGTPLPVKPPRLQTQKASRKPTNSTSSSGQTRSRLPFRHSRTSSASNITPPSSLGPPSPQSPKSDRPATALVGDRDIFNARQGRDQQPHDLARPPAASGAPSSLAAAALFAAGRAYAAAADRPARLSTGRRASDCKYRSHDSEATCSPISPNDAFMYPDQDAGKSSFNKAMNVSFSRTESLSSTSGTTSLSARTMTSSDPSAGDKDLIPKPFLVRNGRTYMNDPSLSYPLPSDLTELHRQCLRTLLLIQVFGAPVCSPSLITKPPMRVLEVGCGSGFWSMMCHRYFKARGHAGISFTGIDIAPLAPGSANTASDGIKPDRDMKWRFIHHDLRHLPWPLPDEEYDLVMVKDMSLATTNIHQQLFIDQYLRLLRPGGTLEIWESDHTIRMLRPHVPGSGNNDDTEEQETASRLGAYIMTANTPLSAPLNTFLVEYNHWLSRALESRDLSAVPCTLIGPMLLQEADVLTNVQSRRLAIPLSEVRWEREGVGGVVTKDGKSYVEMKNRGAPHQKVEKKSLTSGQAALRKTALLTVVQQVQALEPILREVSGKSIDEWDLWLGKMMGDLMSESGTSWGECLEVGAWWARKHG